MLIWVARIIFAALLIGLLGFTGLYVASSGASGLVKISQKLEIAAHPAEIYPWLIEPDKLLQWIGGLVEIRPLSEGGFKVGARSIEVVENEDGDRTELLVEVTDLSTDEYLEVHINSDDIFTGVARYFLVSKGNGTTLEYYSELQFTALQFKLLTPFIATSALSKIQADLQRLKSLIEN